MGYLSTDIISISAVIPLNHTFGALVDTFNNFDSDAFIPDFWSKETDPTQNCVTLSGVWWEWQHPNKKVIDAINKEGHLGLETVSKEVEYVVVLVKKGEKENGRPIGEYPISCKERFNISSSEIPRTRCQPALEHLQQQFPNHTVAQVRRLLGDDASDVVFDNRSFYHKTNPLFVELDTDATGDTIMITTAKRLDKGKGKAKGP